MIKEYRIKIPKMIPAEYAYFAAELQEKQADRCQYAHKGSHVPDNLTAVRLYCFGRSHGPVLVPSDWLEEIQERSEAEKWVVDHHGEASFESSVVFTAEDLAHAFEAGAETYKKKSQAALEIISKTLTGFFKKAQND